MQASADRDTLCFPNQLDASQKEAVGPAHSTRRIPGQTALALCQTGKMRCGMRKLTEQSARMKQLRQMASSLILDCAGKKLKRRKHAQDAFGALKHARQFKADSN